MRVHLFLSCCGHRGRDQLDDADTGAVELRAQCLGVGVHRGLRGGVAGHGRERQESDAGGDRDEGAGVLPDQVGGEGVDDPDGTEQVGVDRRLCRLEVRGVAQVLEEHDARHGHHGVQLGIPGERGVTGGCDGDSVGDVDADRAEAFFGEFRECLRAAAANGHSGARRGEPPGQLSPDTRGPANDESGVVGEIHEIFPSVPGADGVQARDADSDVPCLVRNSASTVLTASAGCGRASVFPGPPRAPVETYAPHYGVGHEGRGIRQPTRQLPACPA